MGGNTDKTNMTRNNTDYRTKLRAVFLAAIMVVSVVGMSAAFAGAAAANAEDANVDYVDFDGDDVTVIFQGQDVYVVGDDLDDAEGEFADLRRVDNFDTDGQSQVSSSSQVEQLLVENSSDVDVPAGVQDAINDTDTENFVEIETDDLDEGDFFVRGAGELPTNPFEEDTDRKSVV